MTTLVTMKKDTRDGRRERSAHNIVPPLPHTTITYLDYCKKGGGDCRKEERLRSFDTKVRCTADVSSLPSINNVIVIRKPRKFHSSIQNLAARFKTKLTIGHNARAHRLNTIAEGTDDVISCWWWYP